MIRNFEKEDKNEIINLARQFHRENFNENLFSDNFDKIISSSEEAHGIVALHAGQYLGYALVFNKNNNVVIDEIYIKPDFQKLGVSPQIFDFMEQEYPSENYAAFCPVENLVAEKVFKRRNYNLTREKILKY